MPWQGQHDVMIDRFDVRAHLDLIPSRPKKDDSDSSQDSGEEVWEERQASYERYRILVQNEFIGGEVVIVVVNIYIFYLATVGKIDIT